MITYYVFDVLKRFTDEIIKGVNHSSIEPFNMSHIKALYYIDTYPNMNKSFYAYKMAMEKGSMTSVLSTLEKSGFVKFITSHDDKRVQLVSLTLEGEKYEKEMKQNLEKAISEKLKPLSSEEYVSLIKACETIEFISRQLELKGNKEKNAR